MTVIKDCTGSYLRYNDKDYHICNIENVDIYNNGTKVTASFKKIKECSRIDVVCRMYHANEGLINVIKIK